MTENYEFGENGPRKQYKQIIQTHYVFYLTYFISDFVDN